MCFFNSSRLTDTYVDQRTWLSLVQIMACHLFSTKQLAYCQLDPWEQISIKFESKYYNFHARKWIWEWHQQNGSQFVSGSMSVSKWSTHWGRVMHICVSKLTIIGSDNGLSLGWRPAIIWTSARILSIGPLGTNFSEILIELHTFSFKKMHLKMSGKWWPCCLGLNMQSLMARPRTTRSM